METSTTNLDISETAQLQEDTNRSAATQDTNIRKWLLVVDEHVHRDSLEIMKLGLQTDLQETALDRAQTAAEIYILLTSKHSIEVSLSRLIYALEKLGHRRHGFRAVRKSRDFSIEKPSPHVPDGDQEKVQKFYFYQCLVEICVHLDKKYHRRLSAYCASILLDGISPYNMETPCQVLIRLLHRAIINKDDQNKLVDALGIIGADRCIDDIYKYRHMNNLPEIHKDESRFALILEKLARPTDTLRSTASSRTDDGSRMQTLQRLRQPRENASRERSLEASTNATIRSNISSGTDEGSMPRSRTHTTEVQYELTNPPTTDGLPPQDVEEDTNHDVQNTNENLDQLPIQGDEQARLEDITNDIHEAEGTNLMRNDKCHRVSCCLWLCITLGITLVVLSLALCIPYITISAVNNHPRTLKLYENTTVVLTEVHHMLSMSVTVTEDTKHIGDFYRDIEIFHLGFGCNELPAHREINTIANGSELTAVNATTIYALDGSLINFSICAKTNYTTTEVERLELILERESPSRTVSIGFFHVGTNNKWLCDSKSFLIHERGYYSITFLPPTHETEFVFNATYDLRVIDTQNLHERAIGNYTLHRDEDKAEIALTFQAKESCIVAKVNNNPTTLRKTTHIQLKSSKPTHAYIAVGVVFSMVIILLMIVILILSLIKCCINTKKESIHS